jgi:hypothetical protein
MNPDKEQTAPQEPSPKPAKPIGDPTKTSRSLAIALIVSAILLLAAAGVIIWLIVANNGSHLASNVRVTSPDDTKDVKSVSLVPPATLPVNYAKNDQSTLDATNIYYYDDATNCGITVGVIPVPVGKTIKDVVVDAVVAAQTKGVTTTKNAAGDKYAIKDADGSKTYTFDSVALEQDVKVDGVAFTKQNNVIIYKQFGEQAASLSYACKSDAWAGKQTELAGLIKQFTAKTER